MLTLKVNFDLHGGLTMKEWVEQCISVGENDLLNLKDDEKKRMEKQQNEQNTVKQNEPLNAVKTAVRTKSQSVKFSKTSLSLSEMLKANFMA